MLIEYSLQQNNLNIHLYWCLGFLPISVLVETELNYIIYMKDFKMKQNFIFFSWMAMLMPMCTIISCRFDIAHSKFIAWNRNILNTWTTGRKARKKGILRLHFSRNGFGSNIWLRYSYFDFIFWLFSLLLKWTRSFAPFLFIIATNLITVNISIQFDLFVISLFTSIVCHAI